MPNVFLQDIDLGSQAELEVHSSPRRRKKKKKKSRSGLQPRSGQLLAAGCNLHLGEKRLHQRLNARFVLQSSCSVESSFCLAPWSDNQGLKSEQQVEQEQQKQEMRWQG